jgi:hypothetical protein
MLQYSRYEQNYFWCSVRDRLRSVGRRPDAAHQITQGFLTLSVSPTRTRMVTKGCGGPIVTQQEQFLKVDPPKNPKFLDSLLVAPP